MSGMSSFDQDMMAAFDMIHYPPGSFEGGNMRSPDARGNLGMCTFRDLKREGEVFRICIQDFIGSCFYTTRNTTGNSFVNRLQSFFERIPFRKASGELRAFHNEIPFLIFFTEYC